MTPLYCHGLAIALAASTALLGIAVSAPWWLTLAASCPWAALMFVLIRDAMRPRYAMTPDDAETLNEGDVP